MALHTSDLADSLDSIINTSTTLQPYSNHIGSDMAVDADMVPAFYDPVIYSLGKWSNLLIFILGLFTNPLVLVILSKRKIGSHATRICLMFLAVSDMGSILVAFFINYVPYYWYGQWFQVYYSDFSCGLANMIHGTVNTMASWYIVLMTAERFAVVCFPMKTKGVFTQRRVIIVCSILPVICMAVYSPFFFFMGLTTDDTGYNYCTVKSHIASDAATASGFKFMVQLWIVLYFMAPAAIIVVLNIIILTRLFRAKQVHKTVAAYLSTPPPSHVMSAAPNYEKSELSDISMTSGSYTSSGSSVADVQGSRESGMSEVSRAHISSIKKGTRLVVIASVVFVIMMLPRGVSVSIYLDAHWTYNSHTEYVLDHLAYILQYFNHSTNFFLYVLAHKKFRFSS